MHSTPSASQFIPENPSPFFLRHRYPSIIRASNLCYSTIVLDDAKYGALRGVEYEAVETGLGTFKFAQAPRGVVPSLLEDLAKFRKQAKRDMAAAEAAGDGWAASVFNGKQLAFKITMNSVYGFLGATKGMLPLVYIAASVTSIGRSMIQKTKGLVESLVPGSRVVYGDSVAGYTPVVVRRAGVVRVTTFEALADEYGVGGWYAAGDGAKQACELLGADVWSDAGWTPMHRVIRHRAGKPLVRVCTPTGIVDVTADHSMLRPDGSPVSPRDLAPGDALLHADLPPLAGSAGLAGDSLTPEEARIMGLFFVRGSTRPAWVVTAPSPAAAEDLLERCAAAYPGHAWASSGPRVFTLSEPLARHYRGELYLSGSKVVPVAVLNGGRDVRAAFWRGMCDGRGPGAAPASSHLSAACVALLAGSLGMKTAWSQGRDALDMRVVGEDPPDKVTTVRALPDAPGAYVYDVTTANHHFAAGVGRLVVHNTDSVMVIFKVDEGRRHDMGAHFEVATRVAAQVSATFKPPNELEHEKCYYPYLLFSKKRYAGEPQKNLWETQMNALARLLAIYLALVFVDAALGFELYRKLVRGLASLVCFVLRRTAAERDSCTARVFQSRLLWLLISVAMGLAAGYVALQALATQRW